MTAQDNRPQPHILDVEPLPPRNLGYGLLFPSALGQRYEAPAEPLILYGHDALDAAQFFAHATTISTLAIRRPDHLEQALQAGAHLGIFAMSPPERPGDAARAIDLFRRLNPGRGVLLYGAWTMDVPTACAYAAEAGADGVIMPACDAGEMFAYIQSLLQGVEEGVEIPAGAAAHEARLKLAFTASPFWFEADPEPVSVY